MLRDRERDVIVESGNSPDTKGFATASILAALHPSVWFLGVGLVIVVLGLAAFFNRNNMEQFVHILGISIVVIVSLVVLVILYKAYRAVYGAYHSTKMAAYDRQIKRGEAQEVKALARNAELKNELLETKLQIERMKPEAIAVMIQQGMRAGQNVKAFGVEVSSPFSNVHTLGAGPAALNPQNLLGPGQPTIQRPSLASLVQAVEYNSFNFALGANVATYAPIIATLIDNHLKIIGASGQGKSSFVASLLDQFTQTHDEQHLQIAILDLEDKTGRLFEKDSHVKMHVRNQADVARALLLLADFMEERYHYSGQYGESWLSEQPHVLVYFEEFIDWKRNLSKFVDKNTCELALNAFTTLATRGRKANIHLMVCTQVNYADKELVEAFAQFVGVNVCLGLKVQAALAAGFIETELLKENYAAKIPGRFVVEKQGGAETGVAADYDARALLKELPGSIPENGRLSTIIEPLPDLSEFARASSQSREEPGEEEEEVETGELEGPSTDNISIFPIAQPANAARFAPTLDDAIQAWNEAVSKGIELSRYTLRDRLQEKGFECGENRARDFLKTIKAQIEKNQERA